ncbi:hypothetical protein J4G62_13665 [Aeromonas caviae]|uniref:hypothetical protein n=1 Tax=Aeromonas caviae TaxID=648 RepID=UPI001BD3682F|nr:hypothetical protein [Aeromonas caviae]MBS4721295.1 hypothetical protein [Aeromonas caviae]
MLYSFAVIISFFLFIFDPWFFGVGRGVIISAALVLPIIILGHKKVYIDIKLMLALMLFTILSILPAIYNGTAESGVFFMYVKMVIYFFISATLASVIRDTVHFRQLLNKSILIQFLVMALCLLSVPYLIDFAYSVHTADSKFYNSEQAYRLFFITSSAFFQFSLFWGFIFNFYLASYNNEKSYATLFIVFLTAFCGLMSGRSFMVFAAISVFFHGMKIKYIPYYIIVIALISYIIYLYQDNIYAVHAMEPILNFISKGELETSSSDSLLERHLFWPNEIQLLIGDGVYYNSDGSYYGHTDSGFVRQALYGGFLYVILCMSFFSYLIYRAAFNWFSDSQAWSFFLSTSMIAFLGNIKADVYMYPALLMNIIFLMLSIRNVKK